MCMTQCHDFTLLKNNFLLFPASTSSWNPGSFSKNGWFRHITQSLWDQRRSWETWKKKFQMTLSDYNLKEKAITSEWVRGEKFHQNLTFLSQYINIIIIMGYYMSARTYEMVESWLNLLMIIFWQMLDSWFLP